VIVIGIDPHKRQHTAAALERLTQRQCDSIASDASLADYRRLLAWAKRWPQRTCAIENARGLDRHLARWLLARGETVVDVPATATRRVRELSRGGRRKNDVIDAAAAASVAALHGNAISVDVEDVTAVLTVLDERRVNLAHQRVRLVDHGTRITRRAREDTRGRLCDPARLAQPRQPALRTSHFPDPPTISLRPPATTPLDRHRGTPQDVPELIELVNADVSLAMRRGACSRARVPAVPAKGNHSSGPSAIVVRGRRQPAMPASRASRAACTRSATPNLVNTTES
jgi:hypothetical protein